MSETQRGAARLRSRTPLQQMPFAISAVSFWRSYYNADDFCGSWFSENYVENVLSRKSCCFVVKALAGCAHNSWLSTSTTDGELIAALGASYVHST